jgi:hypothetical protein
MTAVYLVIGIFVTALLLCAPLFPFWKVWARIRSHHPDIWRSAGPFDLGTLAASPGMINIFLSVVMKMNTDKALLAQDPELARWVRVSVEMLRLVPRSLQARIVFGLIFAYLLITLTRFLIAH